MQGAGGGLAFCKLASDTWHKLSPSEKEALPEECEKAREAHKKASEADPVAELEKVLQKYRPWSRRSVCALVRVQQIGCN